MKASMIVCISLGYIKYSTNEIITTFRKSDSYEYYFSSLEKRTKIYATLFQVWFEAEIRQ